MRSPYALAVRAPTQGAKTGELPLGSVQKSGGFLEGSPNFYLKSNH